MQRGEQFAEHWSWNFSSFDPSQCPTLDLRPKHIWPKAVHSYFVILRMNHIWDIVFENYSASGTCIVFSQVIAMVIQRVEPTEA